MADERASTLIQKKMFPWKKIVFSGETDAPTFCALVYKYGSENMSWDDFVGTLKRDSQHSNKLVRSMASVVLFYIHKILYTTEVDKSIDHFFGEILAAIDTTEPREPREPRESSVKRRSTRPSRHPVRYTPI